MQYNITNDPTATRMVSVAEAARALGISSEAVRMRLRRKSLDGFRDDGGHWQVQLAATQRMTEPGSAGDAAGDQLNAPPTASAGRNADELADLRAERDRLLDLLEVALSDRRDQPPSVLNSLRQLVATLTDWVVERVRRRDSETED